MYVRGSAVLSWTLDEKFFSICILLCISLSRLYSSSCECIIRCWKDGHGIVFPLLWKVVIVYCSTRHDVGSGYGTFSPMLLHIAIYYAMLKNAVRSLKLGTEIPQYWLYCFPFNIDWTFTITIQKLDLQLTLYWAWNWNCLAIMIIPLWNTCLPQIALSTKDVQSISSFLITGLFRCPTYSHVEILGAFATVLEGNAHRLQVWI